jgi:ParB-like chromosome segregation protein Spo0J
MELTINQKFRDLLDIPSDAERKELERQLIRDGGPRDPIVIRKGTNEIVDGHNRYAICMAHGLKFKTIEREFATEEAVEEWIIENQLARRNLSPVRATYFLGLLYNKMKQTDPKREATTDGKYTSEKLAEQFGVNERTVRRAGQQAAGIDVVGEAKGLKSVQEKLAAIKSKNEGFTNEELAVLGKEKDKTVAVTAAKTLIQQKAAEAKKKIAQKKPAPAAAPAKKETYSVVFSKPKFDKIGFSVKSEERPPMAENCMVYMVANDEDLAPAMELMKTWGLTHEASFIFRCDGHEGPWSDIQHMFLLAASKGTMTGPKKASSSIIPASKDISIEAAMLKLVQVYHQNGKLLDMRK